MSLVTFFLSFFALKFNPPNPNPNPNPFPKVVLGDFDNDMLKIDWDERYYGDVKRQCKILVKKYPFLEGFIILESSTKKHNVRNIGNGLSDISDNVYSYKSKNYHAVFNGVVAKDQLNSILADLCLQLHDENLTKWFLMQLIKETFTLRIGFKGKKKPPRIVYRWENQDKQIAKFLETRNFILEFLELNSES